MEMEIKEYQCDLKRKHVFMFSAIIKKLNIDISKISLKNVSENEYAQLMEIGISVLKLMFENISLVEKESQDLICSIYNISPQQLDDIGLQKEFELWKNIFTCSENKVFFKKAFLFLEKAQENSSTLFTADTITPN